MTPGADKIFDLGAQLERTTLAWMRTALGLTALGVLIGRFSVDAAVPPLGFGFGALVVVIGVTAAVSAVRSYDRREAAMRAGRPVVAPRPLLGVGLTLTLGTFATLGIVLT
jgi:uncharacterized membrane protein YidH (DUF202 family)